MIANAHAVDHDRSLLAVEDLVGTGELFFQRRRNRDQLESRTRLVDIAHGAVLQRLGSDSFRDVRIEGGPVGQCQDFAGVRIFDNHRAGSSVRLQHRPLQFMFGDVLNFLINRKDEIVARLRLLLDATEPLAPRVHRNQHLPRLAV